MAIPNESLFTPEGLASYEIILNDDQYSIPDGDIPVRFAPKADNEGRYEHDILFNVLNKQIKEFNPKALVYDPTLYGTAKIENINEGYANIYRAVLSDIGSKDPMFNSLAPTLKKRIIDDYSVRLNGMHHHFIDNMPNDISNNEKNILGETYNNYMSEVMLPNIAESLNKYAHEQSVNASGDRFWRTTGTAFANLMAGAATQLRDDTNLINTEDYADWFQGVAEYVKGRVDRLDPATGTFSLSPEESMRDVGGLSIGPLDIPTLKDGYLYHTVIEGLQQQIITSGLPMAGAAVGGALGFKGGPIGGLLGAGAGATIFSTPGHLVETGAFKDELMSEWKQAKEDALFAKQTNRYSPEEFQKRFTVDLGRGGVERKITADELTPELMEEMSDNMAQLYALHSTAIEIAGSVTGGMASFGVKAGMNALGKKWANSKLGQRMMANTAFSIVKKPMSALPEMFTQAVQEGYVERLQEGMNISMMKDALPEYKQLTEEQEKSRLNQATFIGSVIGGKFSAVGQTYSGIRDARVKRELEIQDDNNNAKRFVEIERLKADMLEKDTSGRKLYLNDVDLAVQIGMMADVELQESLPFIVKNVSDDVNQIDRIHQARMRITMSEAQRQKLNVKLLNTPKGKAMMEALNLNAKDFVSEMTLEDFKKTFPVDAKEVLDELAQEIDLDKRAEKEAKLTQNYTDSDNVSDYNDDNKIVVSEKDKILKTKQNKIQSKIKALVNERKKNPKKFTKKKQKDLAKLSKNYNAITDKILKRNESRNSAKTDGKGKKSLTENSPTAITKLVMPFKMQVKTDSKMEFYKAKKNGIDILLEVVGQGEKKNAKGVKEKYFTVKIKSNDPNYNVKNQESFNVFDSEIDSGWNKKMKKAYKPLWKQEPKEETVVKKEEPKIVWDAEKEFEGFSGTPRVITGSKKDIKAIGKAFENKNLKKAYDIISNFFPDNVSVRIDRRKKVPASFNRKTNTITFNPKLIESQEQLEYTLLHELTHSVSAKVIQDYFDGNLEEGSAQHQAVEELDTLFNVIKRQLTFSEQQGILELNQFIKKLKKNGLTVKEKEIAKTLRKKFYGFTNLKEFVSELMVNDEFQQNLEKIKFTADDRTLLRKIFDVLAKVLVGADTKNLKDTDALVVALRSSFNVMEAQKTKVEINAEKTFSSYDQPLEIGTLENTTEATYDDISEISDNMTTVYNDFKKSGYKTMETYMATLGNRVFKNPKLIKGDDGSILILDKKNRAIAEIKSDPKAKGLREERITLLLPGAKPFSVNTVSVNNANAQVAKYNIPPLKDTESIKVKDSQQKAKEQVDKDTEKKVKSINAVVIKGPPKKGVPMKGEKLESVQSLDSYLENNGFNEEASRPVSNEDVDITANNIHEDLTNEDEYLTPDEDDDIGLIDWSKKARNLLTPSSKKRADKAFAYGFHQLVKKFNLPLSYWEDYKRQMSENLENTLLADAFNSWAKEYEVNLEVNLDKIGIYATQDWEIEFSDKFNDGALSDIADTMQDAWDATEEFLRQGIGLTETGKIESDTKSNNFYKMDSAFFRAIGVTPTTSNSQAFYDLAIKATTPEAFLNAISEDSFITTNKTYSNTNMTPLEAIGDSVYNKMILVRFWNSQQRINRTPTNRGRQQKGAVRSLFGVFTKPKYAEDGSVRQKAKWKFLFKGRKNKNSNWLARNKGSKNTKFQKLYKNLPNKMRTRAAETLFDDGELVYMSTSDMWRWDTPDLVVNKDGTKEKLFSVRKSPNSTLDGYKALIGSALQQGVVPLFTRGDGKLIPMVKISDQHKAWAGTNASYWKRELDSVPDKHKERIKTEWVMGYIAHFNRDEVIDFFPPSKNGKIDDSYRTYNSVQIARHEAYKKLYGEDYWVHMTPHNIIHRAKIPFSEGTRSNLMPDKKLVTFDTRIDLGGKSKAKMTKVYEDGRTEDINLVQQIDNQYQYIWDGSTWTSEINFVNDYHNFLGTNKSARRAKTTFYVGGNEGAILQKHQEFAFFMEDGVLEVKLTDGNGDFVATIKKDESGFVNIYDKNNQMIDYLGTPDETKAMTGQYANQYNETITIPGSAVTMIQFARDNDKSNAKFFTQLLNYFPSNKFQNLVMDYFKDTDVKRQRSPVQSFNLLNNVVSNPSEMDQFKIGYVRATIDGVPLGIARNAMAGVGFHPSDAGTNENVVKNGIVRTAIDFLGYGSKLDFRMDAMGTLSDNEIVLPYDHKIAKNIIKIMKAKGVTGEITKADVNKWLESNPIEVLAVRSPVPSRFGYRVLRVKKLENIGDTFIVNPKIVKQVFEGDGDGDTASIQFLTGKHKNLMKWLKDNQELTSGLGLEASGQSIDLATLSGLANAMYNMSLGKNAVAQIGNMAKVAGVMTTWFKQLEVDGRIIKMRKLTDTYYDPDTKKTASIENLYRMYMQAAADHAKLLLLGPDHWNYSRQKLYSALFYYSDNPTEQINNEHYNLMLSEIISPTTKGLSVIGGKYQGNELSFKEHYEFGEEYSEWISNRKDTIIENQPYAKTPDFIINKMVKEYLKTIGVSLADLGEGKTEYIEDVSETIRSTIVQGRLRGSGQTNHALEQISTSVYDEGIKNGWDGDVFKTPFAKIIALHQKVLTNIGETWNKTIVDELMLEAGITQKQINKMKKSDRDNWAQINLMPQVRQAQKFAQGLSTELRMAINDKEQDDVEAIDQSFSSNQYQMNDRENSVIEGWIARINQNNLTPAQRKLFTWSYLQDVTDTTKIRGTGSLRLHIAFPPVDPIDPRNSILDPEMMQQYFKAWNQLNKDSDFVTPNIEDIGVMQKTTKKLKEEFERRGCIV